MIAPPQKNKSLAATGYDRGGKTDLNMYMRCITGRVEMMHQSLVGKGSCKQRVPPSGSGGDSLEQEGKTRSKVRGQN